ncbi:MAG TPA: hypothetical protein VH083_22900 [Myxococcales bacterium]|jgi:hypothetical protein|nr:hypothetical protein [Myxococcales bacterium]
MFFAALLLAAFFCPPAQRVAAGFAQLKQDQAPLQLKALPGCAEEQVEGVDLFASRLTGAGDKVLQVRARGCGVRSLRIAVLVPIEGGVCKLSGEDLSLDQKEDDKPCTDAPGKLPRTLDFVRGTIQVRDQCGSCGDPDGSASSRKLSIFNVQGWQLKKIFETPLWDSTTQAQGRQLVQTWKVTFAGGKLTTQRCVEGGQCEDPDEFIYSKPGGKYVRK